MTPSWDRRFLELAQLVSTWSKDPSTRTGAVITDGKKVVSVGYNGYPKGVADDESLHDRELKYKKMVHCERNAVVFAGRSVEGCTLYTVPFMSCAPCAALMIQVGIGRVVAPKSDNPRWQPDFEIALDMFRQAGVEVTLV